MTEIVYLPGVHEPANQSRPEEELKPVASVVNHLESMLELAKAGKVLGVAMVPLFNDNSAAYSLAGNIGGYGMLGAMECLKIHIIDINMEAAEEHD